MGNPCNNLKRALQILAQQIEYETFQPDPYSPKAVPIPEGYVYHVSPYAHEIVNEGFSIDPTRTTLGAFGPLMSISTTNYENAQLYKGSIELIVGTLNGELNWQGIFDYARQYGANDQGITDALAASLEDSFLTFWNANTNIYDLMKKIPGPVSNAVDAADAFKNRILPPEAQDMRISPFLRSHEGKNWLARFVYNETDFEGNPISEEADERRRWKFLQAIAYWSSLPTVIGYDPPEHLKSRRMRDVGIVEVAVAPVEYESRYVEEGEGKGRYTYQPGEQEWKFYDVTDLWPARVIE
jgi:hypothetical protein